MQRRSITLILLLLCSFGTSCDDPAPTPAQKEDAGPQTATDATEDMDRPEILEDAPADVDPAEEICREVDDFRPFYDDAIARWTQQDQLWPRAPGSLLLVGSSSVRRWEDFARLYSAYAPLQRGFGGGQLAEAALRAQDLIIAPQPAGVIVFAGTNDIAFGVSPDTVIARFACLRRRIGLGLGWDTPVLFLGITPTPARWSRWERAQTVNQAIANLAREDLAVHYVDIPAAFLATGQPPAPNLFVEDRLHLSPEGYDLWHSVLQPMVETLFTPQPTVEPGTQALTPGTRILVDLGPDDALHGESTPSPDPLGQHWNHWHSITGNDEVLPGEQLSQLRDDQGQTTHAGMVITGGFLARGWRDGGHRLPTQEDLGPLAVGSATGDFFHTSPPDRPGGFFLHGLDPAQDYTLRFFASQQDPQRSITRYLVHGAQTQSAQLQVAGEGAGPEGTSNLSNVASLDMVRPDPWGRVFVDVQIVEGDSGYLSLFTLEAQ